LLFNSYHENIDFRLPPVPEDCEWQSVLDTHVANGLQPDGVFRGGDTYPLESRSLALLMQRKQS
ncbi:MAG: hypothetical protein JNM54_11615, partial [Candidatus Accumulibacter sp.]